MIIFLDLIVDSSKEEDFFSSTFKSPEQISNELVTLSLLPHSRWHSLLHLDVIKVENICGDLLYLYDVLYIYYLF